MAIPTVFAGSVNHYVGSVNGKIRRAIVASMRSGTAVEVIEECDSEKGYYVVWAGFSDNETEKIEAEVCRLLGI